MSQAFGAGMRAPTATSAAATSSTAAYTRWYTNPRCTFPHPQFPGSVCKKLPVSGRSIWRSGCSWVCPRCGSTNVLP